MSKLKKPTLKQQLESGPAATKKPRGANFIPNSNYSISPNKRQPGNIERILPHGEENALTAREIASIMGCGDVRVVTRLIEKERRTGAPIAATPRRGYFLAADLAEWQRYINALDRRIRNIEITRLHCGRTLNRWGAEDGIREARFTP